MASSYLFHAIASAVCLPLSLFAATTHQALFQLENQRHQSIKNQKALTTNNV